MKRVCPECGETRWAWVTAKKADARLRAGALYWHIHHKRRHVAVSFREDQNAPEDLQHAESRPFQEDFPRVYRTLKTMGFWGGVAVLHPWRKHCLGCHGPFEGMGCRRCRPFPGFEWVFSPHYHVIGYGAINAEDRPAGAVVKTISRTGEARSWKATLKYILDHCGARPGCHAIRWFGWFSYNKLPRSEIPRRWLVSCPKAKVAPQCPRCGVPMERTGGVYELDYEIQTDRPPPGLHFWAGGALGGDY